MAFNARRIQSLLDRGELVNEVKLFGLNKQGGYRKERLKSLMRAADDEGILDRVAQLPKSGGSRP